MTLEKLMLSCDPLGPPDTEPLLSASLRDVQTNKNSSGDEIANVNFFYNIAHVEASAYAH